MPPENEELVKAPLCGSPALDKRHVSDKIKADQLLLTGLLNDLGQQDDAWGIAGRGKLDLVCSL
jgi:hypothetical protein